MTEALEKIADDVRERAADSRFNSFIAVFVTVVATFMALCNLKDGNIIQSMQHTEAKAIDQWAYYQSKSLKQHLAEDAVGRLEYELRERSGAGPQLRARLQHELQQQSAAAARYEREKLQVKAEAEGADRGYEAINLRDDQFDLAEACLSASVAIAGVTALTRKRWLFAVACSFAGIGFLFGLAGFFGWGVHSEVMARVLG